MKQLEKQKDISELKYEYMLYTWGGFYNKEYKKIHKEEPGYKWFNYLKEREDYFSKLQNIEKSLKAEYLVRVVAEGYTTRIPTIVHRVIRYENKEYYTTQEYWPSYDLSAAEYGLEYKFYPGFNDYPLGEDFDYNKIEIIQEWTTGAFEFKRELEINRNY